MKFKRNVSYEKHLEDRFVNSFYKTGFINEDIFDRDSRDMWKAFVRILSNSNSSSIFSSLLIAYRKVPYSPELLQKVSVNTEKKLTTEGYENKSSEVFADIRLDYYEFYECVFIKSPYMYSYNKRTRECIYNTLKIIKNQFSEANGYTLVESSILALSDSGDQADTTSSEYADPHRDLFIRNNKTNEIETVTMMVPMLIDDSYYMIDGIRNYPIISEAYHYQTSTYGQKEFIYKFNIGSNSYKIGLGYFDSAFLDMGDGPEIFYIKTSSTRFYNPLMFLNKVEAKELFDDIMAEKYVKPDIKRILENTYEHYLKEIDNVRKENVNTVPNIRVWRHNDSFFGERLEEEFSDEKFVVKRFNRRMISKNTIKSLIMGFNNVRYYTFYGHMSDIYLATTNKIANKKKVRNVEIPSDDMPKDKAIYATIRSNKDLCANYDNKNPYDVWARVSYKKHVNLTKDEIKKTNGENNNIKSGPKDYMRYLTEEEYTLIDPTTVKSENTAGIVSSFTLFNHRKWAFRKAEDV